MRIAIAEFKQETNSFVPFTTTVKTFEDQYLYRGADIFTAFGSARLEVPGALDALKNAGAPVGHHGNGVGHGRACQLRNPDA
jgi:microcystin degradation protein MlrC